MEAIPPAVMENWPSVAAGTDCALEATAPAASKIEDNTTPNRFIGTRCVQSGAKTCCRKSKFKQTILEISGPECAPRRIRIRGFPADATARRVRGSRKLLGASAGAGCAAGGAAGGPHRNQPAELWLEPPRTWQAEPFRERWEEPPAERMQPEAWAWREQEPMAPAATHHSAAA